MRVSNKTVDLIEKGILRSLKVRPGQSGAGLVRSLATYPEATIRHIVKSMATKGEVVSRGLKASQKYYLPGDEPK